MTVIPDIFMIYMLDENKNVVPIDIRNKAEVYKWGNYMKNVEGRRVGHDIIHGLEVSTIFLGTNLNIFASELNPKVFETMVFTKEGISADYPQRRYSNWLEAKQGHDEIIKLIKKDIQ